MKIAIISFTQRGMELGEAIRYALTDENQDVWTYAKSQYLKSQKAVVIKDSLQSWTKEKWQEADALIFVGACGIAVRAIAPYVKDKFSDPAVLVLDEKGTFCISLLSGHVGGANELTRIISGAIESIPVITTATDVNGYFAIDEFAKKHEMELNRESMKHVSAALLAGKQIISAGIGCRKGTSVGLIEKAVNIACKSERIPIQAIKNVASIDLKKQEPGLRQFCEQLEVPFITYTKEELNTLEGNFTPSVFVESVTGVDNVCERSAVLASGHGTVIMKKTAFDGVTVALAVADGRKI
ncbi:MAG: cobalt-precorrin 5A hydrolase [Lachnospiraceae bacterium]|nr:cobalt-precorrin 5A hydrolase [Lachnospiraceae bacterium]